MDKKKEASDFIWNMVSGGEWIALQAVQAAAEREGFDSGATDRGLIQLEGEEKITRRDKDGEVSIRRSLESIKPGGGRALCSVLQKVEDEIRENIRADRAPLIDLKAFYNYVEKMKARVDGNPQENDLLFLTDTQFFEKPAEDEQWFAERTVHFLTRYEEGAADRKKPRSEAHRYIETRKMWLSPAPWAPKTLEDFKEELKQYDRQFIDRIQRYRLQDRQFDKPPFSFSLIQDIDDEDIDYLVRWSWELDKYPRCNVYESMGYLFDRINTVFFFYHDMSRAMEIQVEINKLSRKYKEGLNAALFFLSAKAWLFKLGNTYRAQQRKGQIQAQNEMEARAKELADKLREFREHFQYRRPPYFSDIEILEATVGAAAEKSGIFDALPQIEEAIMRKVSELKAADLEYANEFHNRKPLQGDYFPPDVYLACQGMLNALVTAKWRDEADKPTTRAELHRGVVKDICCLMDLWDKDRNFGMTASKLNGWWKGREDEQWREGDTYQDVS